MRLAGLIPLFVLVGCGDDGSGAGGTANQGGSGGAVASTDGFSLEATSWSFRSTYHGASPKNDRRFVLVEQTLSNVSAEPVVLNPLLFHVETDTGILVDMSASALPEGLCPADTSVKAGASFDCALLFEVPLDATPTMLSYENGVTGQSAAAAFGPEDATGACDTATLNACVGCITSNCMNQLQTLYENQCIDGECSDAEALCGCLEATTGSCAVQADAFLTCADTQCSDCG